MKSQHAFFGVYRGTVVSNLDPEYRGRITAKVPQVLGSSTTVWALPCVPPGWTGGLVKNHETHQSEGGHAQFSGDGTHSHTAHTSAQNGKPWVRDPQGPPVPQHVLTTPTPAPGSGIWVMFEGGDPSQPVWVGTLGG